MRILAWVDENTLELPFSSMQILEYCSVLTLFHISNSQAWYLKDHFYYPNIGASYKPNKVFIRRRCAGVLAGHRSQNEITFWLAIRRKHETNLRKKGVAMVFASTLQVGSVGHLQVNLIYTGAHICCRHLLFHRCLSSWVRFILPLQNQFSQKMLSLRRERLVIGS